MNPRPFKHPRAYRVLRIGLRTLYHWKKNWGRIWSDRWAGLSLSRWAKFKYCQDLKGGLGDLYWQVLFWMLWCCVAVCFRRVVQKAYRCNLRRSGNWFHQCVDSSIIKIIARPTASISPWQIKAVWRQINLNINWTSSCQCDQEI